MNVAVAVTTIPAVNCAPASEDTALLGWREKLSDPIRRVGGMNDKAERAASSETLLSEISLPDTPLAAPPGATLTQAVVDKAGVVEALRDAARRQRRAEIDQLSWVAAAADAWGWIDEVPDKGSPALLHGERLYRFGADGTPEVAEFVTHEIGPALGISPSAAATLIADVLDLRHRLPLLWDAVQSGVIRVWVAREVAKRVRRAELSLDQAQLLDAHLAPEVHGWTPGRVLSQTDRLIITTAPELAEAKARKAAADRYVAVGRQTDGCVGVYGQIDGAGSKDLDATLTRIAGALAAAGDERPVRELRAVALTLMADPARVTELLETGTLPAAGKGRHVDLVVHLDPEQLETGAGGEILGLGAAARSQLEALLTGAQKVTVLPVLDPMEEESADGYDIPDSLRRRVVLRNQFSVFPWSSRRSDSALIDIDHTIAWPQGPTAASNLGPEDRTSHRAKTFGGYSLTQVRPGVFRWRTPTGQVAWVSPHGTFDKDPATDGVMVDIRRRAREVIRAAAERYRNTRLNDPTLPKAPF